MIHHNDVTTVVTSMAATSVHYVVSPDDTVDTVLLTLLFQVSGDLRRRHFVLRLVARLTHTHSGQSGCVSTILCIFMMFIPYCNNNMETKHLITLHGSDNILQALHSESSTGANILMKGECLLSIYLDSVLRHHIISVL